MNQTEYCHLAPTQSRRGDQSYRCTCGASNEDTNPGIWRVFHHGSIPLCFDCARAQHPELAAIADRIHERNIPADGTGVTIVPSWTLTNDLCQRQFADGKYCGESIDRKPFVVAYWIGSGGIARAKCRCDDCQRATHPRLFAALHNLEDPKSVVVAQPEAPKPTEAELLQAARARIHADLTRALSAVGRPQTATAIMAAIDAMIGAAK